MTKARRREVVNTLRTIQRLDASTPIAAQPAALHTLAEIILEVLDEIDDLQYATQSVEKRRDQ